MHGNPVSDVKNLRTDNLRPRGLDRVTVNRLLKAADLVRAQRDGDFFAVRDQLSLYLLLYSGARVSELCALEVTQLSGKWFRDVKGKGRNFRDVFVPKPAREILAEYLPLRDGHLREAQASFEELSTEDRRDLEQRFPARIPDPRPLLLNRYAGALTRQAVSQALDRIARFGSAQFGEEIHFHPHAARHTFALDLLERADEIFVADRLGHQSLQYVRTYTQRDEKAVEAIMDGS